MLRDFPQHVQPALSAANRGIESRMEHLVAAYNATIAAISRDLRLSSRQTSRSRRLTGRRLVKSAESERRIRARKRVERGGRAAGSRGPL
jgi:hypothetical protein